MWSRLGSSLIAMVIFTANVFAQGSPLDKLQASQIPEEERAGLPADVVAVVGSSRGWVKEPARFIKAIHFVAPDRMITETSTGIHLWDLETLRVLDATPAGSMQDFSTSMRPSILTASEDGKRLLLIPPVPYPNGSFPTLSFPAEPEFWRIRNGKFSPVAILYPLQGLARDTISSAVFQSKSDKLVTLGSGFDGTAYYAAARTWDLSARPIKEVSIIKLSELPFPAKHKTVGSCLTDGGRGLAAIVQEVVEGVEDSGKQQIVFIDLDSKKTTRTLSLPGRWAVRSFRLSADNRRLLILDQQLNIRVYDLVGAAAKMVFVSAKLNPHVENFAWDAAGQKLAYFGCDAKEAPKSFRPGENQFTLRLADLASTKLNEQILEDKGLSSFESMAMTADGKTLLVVSPRFTGRIEAWDLTAAKPTKRSNGLGHQASVTSTAFTSDGKSLLTGGDDRQLCLWDLVGEKPALSQIVQDAARISSLTSAPGGKLWATTGNEPRSVSLWNLEGGKLSLSQRLEMQAEAIWKSGFSSDGQTLYASTAPDWLHDFEMNSHERKQEAGAGLEIWRLIGGKFVFQSMQSNPQGAVFAVAASPVSPLVVAAGGWAKFKENRALEESSEVVAWDFSGPKAKQIASLPGHKNIVRNAVFAPNGKILATSSGDAHIRLWHVNGNDIKLAKELTEQDSSFELLAFSPDSQLLLAWGTTGEIMLWDVKTGACNYSFRLRHNINSLAFAPDGRHFATGNPWGTAYIFRLPPRK